MEIKDNLKDHCYISCRDKWKISVKGKKLIYTDGYCYKSAFCDEWDFKSIGFLRSLLDALAFNVYHTKKIIYPLEKLYNRYCVRLTEDDFKTGFSCPEILVEHIKFYKNGRVDIVFQDAETARGFARNWCGYTMV